MNLVNTIKLNFGNIICSCNLVDCIKMTDEFIEKGKSDLWKTNISDKGDDKFGKRFNY